MFNLQCLTPANTAAPAGKTFTASSPVDPQADGTYPTNLLIGRAITPCSFPNISDWGHFQSAPITSIEDFHAALDAATVRNAILIRGEVAVDQPIIKRRYASEPRHIRDVDREWLALDFEKAPPVPESINFFDLEAVGRHVVTAYLPPEYHTADFIVEATASHGLKGREARLRLFFLLARPVPNHELKAFIAGCNRAAGAVVFDASLYDAGHIHYIVPPTFTGLADPVPVRRQVVKGISRAAAFKAMDVAPGYQPLGGRSYTIAAGSFQQALTALGSGEGLLEGAHDAMLGACLAYHREATTGFCLLDSAEAVAAIKQAVRKGLTTEKAAKRESELTPRLVTGEEVDKMMRWVRSKDCSKEMTELLAQVRWQTGQDVRLKGEFRDDLRALTSADLNEETARRYATAMLGRYQTRVPKLTTPDTFLNQITDAYRVDGRGTDEGTKALADHWDYLQGLRAEMIAQTLDARAIAANAVRLADPTGRRKMAGRIKIIEVDTIEEAAAAIGEEGIYIVQAPHGLGKTRVVMKGLVGEGKKVLALSHRRSLTKEMAAVLGTSHYETDRQHNFFNPRPYINGLAACIDSLTRPDVLDQGKWSTTLLIDEWTQVLGVLHTDSQMAKLKAASISRVLGVLLKNVKLAVLADADNIESGLAYLLQRTGNRDITIIRVKPQVKLPTITVWGSPAELFAGLEEAVRQGKNALFFADSVDKTKQVGELVKQLEKELGTEIPIAIVNSETSGEPEIKELLADVNGGVEKLRVLAYTPTIGSGVSIQTDHFHVHLGVCNGAIGPNESIQLMRRDRTAENINLAFDGQAIRYEPVAAGRLIERWVKRGVVDAKLANSVGCGLTVGMDEWDRARAEAERNRLNNDAHNSLLLLLEARGFTIKREVVVVDEEAYRRLKQDVKLQVIEEVFNAADIEAVHEGRHQPLTAQQHRENEKFFIKKQFVLDELTLDDINFYDGGSVLAPLKRIEILLADEPWLRARRYEDMGRMLPDMVGAFAKKAAYEAVLGVIFGTYQGERVLTEQSARSAWQAALGHKAVLENDHFRVPATAPAHPVKWAKGVLDHFGLGGWVRLQIDGQLVEYKGKSSHAHIEAGSLNNIKNPDDVCREAAPPAWISAYRCSGEKYGRLVEIAQRRLAASSGPAKFPDPDTIQLTIARAEEFRALSGLPPYLGVDFKKATEVLAAEAGLNAKEKARKEAEAILLREEAAELDAFWVAAHNAQNRYIGECLTPTELRDAQRHQSYRIRERWMDKRKAAAA